MAKLKANYLANPKLKKAGVKMDFTPEQVQELIKCSEDPIYFIKKFVKIVSLDEGLIMMNPYPYQERMIKTFHDNRFSIALIARQSGKTVAYVAYALWYILFNDSKKVVILANKAKTARGILSRLKIAYENLPKWIQQGVCEWNKTSIELENGSRVEADSTSGNASRGESINLLILDEFAFVPRNIAEEFFRSVYPTISKGTQTKIIIISTPNGINLFYKLWQEAVKKLNSYVPFTMHWSEVPGRDEKWREETIRNIGKEAFQQEFELEFFGSVNNTLITGSKLRIMTFDTPFKSTNDGLDIYELPQKDHTYVINVDVARGKQNDYSALTIVDASKVPYKVVAKYRSNKIAPMIFPNVIVELAKKYNEAYLLIEVNDTGAEVADIIKHELEYENIFSTVKDKKIAIQTISLGGSDRHKLGVTTSRKVKNIGCANLKTLIEEDKLIVKDFDIISELTTFVSTGVSFAGDSGANDDLVMTLVLFAWLTHQKFFKDLINHNVRDSLTSNQEIFSDIPFVIVDDHQSEPQSMEILDPGDLCLVHENTWLFPRDNKS